MVRVRGGATEEELAAVLAALQGAAIPSEPAGRPSGYERWRRTRLAALRVRD